MNDSAVARPAPGGRELFSLAKLSEIVAPAALSPKPIELPFPQFAGPFLSAKHLQTHGPLPELGVYCFEDCLVGFGGIVVSSDLQILDGADLVSEYWKARLKERLATPNPADLLPQALSGKLAPSSVIAMEEELICLVRPGSAVYGHWLLDMMPMLWLFMNSQHGRSHKRRVLISSLAPAWIYPMLKLAFDLDRDDVVVLDELRTVMRCRRILVPSLLRVSPLISEEYNKFVAHVLSKLDAASAGASDLPTRFYVSRTAVKSTAPIDRQAHGVDAIEASAAARGIAVLKPERMSWVEQLRLFSRAELVVSFVRCRDACHKAANIVLHSSSSPCHIALAGLLTFRVIIYIERLLCFSTNPSVVSPPRTPIR
jgi:capsular polysaccharide biosynthesis protein